MNPVRGKKPLVSASLAVPSWTSNGMKAVARLLLMLALVAPAFASAQPQAPAPAPTCKLFASATRVNYNSKVRLNWESINATSGYLTEVGAITPNGSAYVVPGKNTTYAASFTGPGGSVVCRVAVAVGGGGVRDTGTPINTNVPVNLEGTVDLGGNGVMPAGQTVAQPTAQSGKQGGIVPLECRGRNTIGSCDICSLAQMGQNLANFLLGLTIPAAALLFAWAGILYFSSRGNPTQITQAHKVFRTVVIGFVIAVSAWVLVNTVMNMLIQKGDLKNWSWRELKCQETRQARRYNMSLTDYLTSSLPAFQQYVGGSDTAGGMSCPSGYSYTTEEGGYCQSTDPSTPDAWTEACPTGYVYTAAEGGYCENPDNPDDWVNTDGSRGVSQSVTRGASYTSEQNIWLEACRQGDVDSCQSFSNSSGSGELGARIAAATQQYIGTDTSSGPDGGNLACAWAVNNILQSSGIAPLGYGSDVQSMESALRDGGRGTQVQSSDAGPGDIIVWKQGRVSHVGICETSGCTISRSNSSNNARFSNAHNGTVFRGVPGRIYHVNN